ncbi:unnamed protein product [Vitrella brassicaformis CCMP3155]|uniref:Uncharacterized protein n=1 Tax=Vitrella brassicaformis (strain CCMP3155) TaxID=1169540 RepID=A0A0G4FLB6_VITBC|nr:unnamed protein product [Vitrella brassicaformis CCMP3155]|eukprot:CEM14797.1 unnamed protein product [Vitrella brassicaformis CCMP3155]
MRALQRRLHTEFELGASGNRTFAPEAQPAEVFRGDEGTDRTRPINVRIASSCRRCCSTCKRRSTGACQYCCSEQCRTDSKKAFWCFMFYVAVIAIIAFIITIPVCWSGQICPETCKWLLDTLLKLLCVLSKVGNAPRPPSGELCNGVQ